MDGGAKPDRSHKAADTYLVESRGKLYGMKQIVEFENQMNVYNGQLGYSFECFKLFSLQNKNQKQACFLLV